MFRSPPQSARSSRTAPAISDTDHATVCRHEWHRRADLDVRNSLRYECVQCGCRGRKAFGSADATIQPMLSVATVSGESDGPDSEQEQRTRARGTRVFIQSPAGFHPRGDDDERETDLARAWKDAA